MNCICKPPPHLGKQIENMFFAQHRNDNNKRVVTLQESISVEKMNCGGPDEIRNPDDASGARIEVHRYAQHRNDNNKRVVTLQESISVEKMNCGGPDEIRTHDPRRVKAMS
jgi:surface antigen